MRRRASQRQSARDALTRTPHALLSRGLAGLRGSTLIVNLPGSPGGCRDGFAVLRPALAHALELAAGDQGSRHAPDMSTTALALPRRFASLVKFEHTVFALPFAYVGAFLAVDGYPGTSTLVWLTLAMVGARTLAMALNRLVDAELDARNPRTASPRDPGRRPDAAPRCGRCAPRRSPSISSRPSS